MKALFPMLLIFFGSCTLLSSLRTNDLPRFDGLYEAHNKDYKYYLRFYKDGTVISTSTIDEIDDLVLWFKKEEFKEPYHPIGKYKVRNKIISFTTTSESGSVVYHGKIENKEIIILHVESLINGHKSTITYHFIAFE